MRPQATRTMSVFLDLIVEAVSASAKAEEETKQTELKLGHLSGGTRGCHERRSSDSVARRDCWYLHQRVRGRRRERTVFDCIIHWVLIDYVKRIASRSNTLGTRAGRRRRRQSRRRKAVPGGRLRHGFTAVTRDSMPRRA